MKAIFAGSCPAVWGRERLHLSLGAAGRFPVPPARCRGSGLQLQEEETLRLDQEG